MSRGTRVEGFILITELVEKAFGRSNTAWNSVEMFEPLSSLARKVLMSFITHHITRRAEL